MSVLDTASKVKISSKTAKGAIKYPSVPRIGARAGKPAAKLGLKTSPSLAKRRARRGIVSVGEVARDIGDAARGFGEELATYGPQAAVELGLVEAPKPKRTAPRVAAGMVLGAGAVYFLEPEAGRQHRQKVMNLVA